MDRNLPVEVMIRDIEDVQHFLLANPPDKMELTDVQLCTHGLIKLSKTGGLYAKATERWNLNDPCMTVTDRKSVTVMHVRHA